MFFHSTSYQECDTRLQTACAFLCLIWWVVCSKAFSTDIFPLLLRIMLKIWLAEVKRVEVLGVLQSAGRSLPGGDLGEPSRWSSRPASWGLGPQLCSASATVFPPHFSCTALVVRAEWSFSSLPVPGESPVPPAFCQSQLFWSSAAVVGSVFTIDLGTRGWCTSGPKASGWKGNSPQIRTTIASLYINCHRSCYDEPASFPKLFSQWRCSLRL